MKYADAWEELKTILRQEKKEKEKQRVEAEKGGFDPGLPAIPYVTLLNIIANLEGKHE